MIRSRIAEKMKNMHRQHAFSLGMVHSHYGQGTSLICLGCSLDYLHASQPKDFPIAREDRT